MAIYTVYEPEKQDFSVNADVARFAFVRDGFTWSAFVFAPFWMLRHRLWLSFVLYAIIIGGLMTAAYMARISGGVVFVVLLLIGILIGLEASTLRRWGLRRRRWRDLGIVVADDEEAAQQRFFERRLDRSAPPQASRPDSLQPIAAALQTYRLVTPDAGADVIGLFPEPGAQR